MEKESSNFLIEELFKISKNVRVLPSILSAVNKIYVTDQLWKDGSDPGTNWVNKLQPHPTALQPYWNG